ncbi:MAG: bifunctional oligoribonuclease/PAP phosphatase NrnA [Clostridia bacterium]|nr:bifunctional oligoribonuclease/PAP phosphatase NrnA [Clostridia bacterium]
MSRLSLKAAAERLLGQDNILILCHRFPDGDTIGSAFALCRALRSIGKKVNVMCGDILPSKFSYIFRGIEPMDFRVKYIVAVDVADPSRLGILEKDYGSRVDLSIDHHGSNTDFAKESFVDSSAAAAGEIIFRILPLLGAELTQDIAMALYTAISTDTGCFRYSNVTANTHRIASKLIETGIDSYEVNRVMFETKTRARMQLERAMLDSLLYRFDDKLAIVTITEQMIRDAGASDSDIDGLSAVPRCIEGVKVGVMLRETGNGYKISVRTVTGVNACDICALLGGGHAAAAGCFVKGSLEEARDKIIDAVAQYLVDNS